MLSCCGGKGGAVWDAKYSHWVCRDCDAVQSNDPNYLFARKGYCGESSIKELRPAGTCECGGDKVKTTHAFWCPKHG